MVKTFLISEEIYKEEEREEEGHLSLNQDYCMTK